MAKYFVPVPKRLRSLHPVTSGLTPFKVYPIEQGNVVNDWGEGLRLELLRNLKNRTMIELEITI